MLMLSLSILTHTGHSRDGGPTCRMPRRMQSSLANWPRRGQLMGRCAATSLREETQAFHFSSHTLIFLRSEGARVVYDCPVGLTALAMSASQVSIDPAKDPRIGCRLRRLRT